MNIISLYAEFTYDMNIKSIANTTPIAEALKSDEVKKELRSGSSNERDADGRRNANPQDEKHELSEEELQEVLEALKDIPGIKNHDLNVRYAQKDNKFIFYVEDLKGTVVKRLTTNEAWHIVQSEAKSTGQLLNKAM